MNSRSPTILLVEDDPALLLLLARWLEKGGYEVRTAKNGQDALEAIDQACPSIVVTDWGMPFLDGLELCRWLRTQALPNYVYTIVISARPDAESAIMALEAGADDYLKKPVNKGELLARIRAGLRVLDLESQLNVMAKSDGLTGLPTRRTFMDAAEREWSRSLRHHVPLSFVMVDLDYFKRINDVHGHQVGDQSLRAVAKVLQESCRGSDLVGRYGGEEFVALLPETTEADALLWSNRVRERLAARGELIPGSGIQVTASFGAAQRLADTSSVEQLIDLADQALLVAKRSGRDRAIGFQSLLTCKTVYGQPGMPHTVFHGLTARDVMTTVVAPLHVQDSVGQAAQFFLNFRFNSAPVVDASGNLVGLLSERDVMAITLWPKWWNTQVAEVMKPNVVCYEEDAPVQIIYEFLCRVSIRAVVIVKDDRPTGMISRGSLIRWFTNLLAARPADILEPQELSLQTKRESPPVTHESRHGLQEIAAALVRQANTLAAGLHDNAGEILPLVVGGASRIEELITDLLAGSRVVSVPAAQLASPQADQWTGLAAAGEISYGVPS